MLKARIKLLTDVAEGLRGEYKANPDTKAGGFILDVEKTDGLELADTGGLMSALEKERNTATEANGKLRLFGDLTPDVARAAVAKVAEYAKNPPTDVATAVKARETELITIHTTEKQALQQRADAADAELDRLVVEETLRADVIAEGGSPELLLPAIRPSVRRVKTETGQRVAVMQPDGKNERIGKVENGASVPMTTRQLVQEVKKNPAYAPAFPVKGGGSGGDGKGNAKGTETPADRTKMTPAQRMEDARNRVVATTP